VLSCAQCPWKGDEDETVAIAAEGAVTLPAYADEDDVILSPEDDVIMSPLGDRGRARTLAGGALLGAAVGLALVLWTRRGSRGPR